MFRGGTVVHAYFALEWLKVYPMDQENSDIFINGNLFPDFRYQGNLKREETHESNITPLLILETSSSFIKG